MWLFYFLINGKIKQNILIDHNFLWVILETISFPRIITPFWCRKKNQLTPLAIIWENTVRVLPSSETQGGGQLGREKGATKVFKHRWKSPWVPTLTRPFPNGQANAGSWLGTKNALYYCAQSTNSISWVLCVSSYMTTIDLITACLAHAPKNCTQSGNFQFDINSPFQNTVYPKTTDAFPKIQAWAYNRYSRLHRSCLRKYYGVKDAITADTKTSHEKWIRIFSVFIVIIPTHLLCQMQANSSGAEFLSTISKFIEKKKILSCCLFTSFPEHKNRHFHVVVV